MTNKYRELVKPTYIEEWSPGLYNLSITSIDVPMTVNEAKQICEIVWEGKRHSLGTLPSRIQDALDKMPDGAFVRLGSRSPKDGLWDGDGSFKVTQAKDVLSLFLNSERVFDDLCLAITEDYNPHIWMRQWIDIPKWAEFRCFMRGRKLVGISQYHYRDCFPEIECDQGSIKWAIEQFFPVFVSQAHMDDVVFDVYLKQRTKYNETIWEVRLIEINPFFELTDPCLFVWNRPELFDGRFAYMSRHGES